MHPGPAQGRKEERTGVLSLHQAVCQTTCRTGTQASGIGGIVLTSVVTSLLVLVSSNNTGISRHLGLQGLL